MLEIKHLSKSYFDQEKEILVISDLNLTIQQNEFIVFLGPSGCGKTTLLKLIAGLTQPSSGKILLDGVEILGPSQDKGVVFQFFSLLPWLTVQISKLLS